ncbi:MAG: YraN family protein [Acidobacteriota bacterium]
MLSKIFSFFGSEKSKNKITGRSGEELALKYLEKKGFKILEKNFRVRGGEADLVVKKGENIVVVEVKTRTTEKFGPPQSAVNKRKFRRLLLAGTLFCRKKGYSTSVLRIDVISIQFKNGEPLIRHFENINLSQICQ